MENQQLKERQRQLLKFGDQVVLGGVETGGFVSCSTDLEPQARVEVLRDGAVSPPDYLQCRFEVVHKNHYIERNNFMAVLAKCGIAADDNDDSQEDDVFLRGMLQELKGTKAFKKLSPDVRDKIAEAKLVFDREKSVNSQELERLVGQPVLYGKIVQLRHPASGLFLTVKRTAASVDRGALRLVLSSGHNASWFQIVSGYKTKGDGEQVSYGEVVSFMSSAYHSMAINYSVGTITEQSMLPVEVNPSIAESRELTCSPLVGRFKVIPHSLHSSLIPGYDKLLTGCAAVRFFHHTSGAILTVSRNGKVQFEMHETDGLVTGAESLPRSDGLWQLQPEHLEWAGQPGEYNLKYRLIHIHSGKFLAAKPSAAGKAYLNLDESEGAGAVDSVEGMVPDCAGDLFTTSDQTLPSTLWTFVPLAQGNVFTSELFSVRSYAFLQASCGQWLSQSQAEQKSMVFMADNVEPLQAVVSPVKRDDFVLEMTWVEEHVSSKALTVRGCLQTMEGFALHLRSNHEKIPDNLDRDATFDDIVAAIQGSKLNEIFKKWYSRVYRTLLLMRQMVSVGSVELGDVTVDSGDVASYQQMCKESGLISAVVNALDAVNLRMFFGKDGKAFVKQYRLGSQLITFGTLCHIFIQAACKDNTSVQNYVGDNFRDTLSAHLGGSVKASDTLAAIYKDNLQQIQDVGEKELLGFIDLIRIEGRFPRFMNFLITQCGSAHRPVPRNQNIMAPGFFSDSEFVLVKGVKVVIDKSDKTDCEITWVDRSNGSVKSWRCGTIAGAYQDDLDTADITEWFRSEEFIEKNPNITMFIFYIFQLKLFAAMCYGRNTIAQQILLENGQEQGLGCDFGTLLDLVMSSAVPFALRTACLRLMLYLHIDVDPFFELKIPRTSRLISEADGPGATAVPMMRKKDSKSNVKRDNAHALKDALMDYLKDVIANTPVACTGQCALTLMAVRTVKRMFELGIIEISLGDSNGSTEILRVLQDVLRVIQPQQQPANWQIVMDIKATICTTLEFCLSICTENQIKGMFEEFATTRRTKLGGPASLDTRLPFPGVPSSDEEEEGALILPEPEETEVEATNTAASANSVMSDNKIEALAATLHRYNAAPEERLFYLDCVSLGDFSSGLGVTLLELCRHDHVKLSECAFRLLDNLLGRRRQLIRCMLDTLVVADPETGLLYRRCESLLRLLAVEYKWVASTDKGRKLAALTSCSECFQEMSRMLVPQTIAVPMESDEIDGSDAPVSGKHGPLTCEQTAVRSVELTENQVKNFKEVLHDLRATEMALQFLRLPMRCTKPVPGKDGLQPMPEAVEPERRELFGVVYEFLARLCVWETGNGDVTNNEVIQAYLAKEVPLYMGHVGIQFLNATSTISAIFQNNLNLSRRYLHESIIYRFVQLLLKFGEKRRTRWLTFLRNVAVVGGTPVARSQSVLLMTLSEVEDHVLSLCKTEDDKMKRSYAMANNCHLENKESGAAAQGSWLAYHRASILLLSDCTLGGDPTLVVKASGFLSLQEVLEGTMLPYSEDTPATTTRYVASAYWQFLQNVYFATDTESTRMAVREADNGVWDLQESESVRASAPGPTAASGRRPWLWRTSVIRWVIDEIELAMQPVNEPPTAAIDSDVKYYASAMLPRFVFPALTNYFQRHYLAHSSQLPASHTKTLRELVKSTMTFAFHLRDIHSRNGSKAFKQPRKSTKDFLVALQAASAQLDDGASSLKAKFQGSIMESMAESQGGSQFEGSDRSLTASQSKLVKHNWETFVTSLADKIGVQVNERTGDLSEVRAVEQGQGPVLYASLHIMSRLLSQPHQLQVKRKGPSGSLRSLGWTWEEVPLHLCKFLFKQHNEISWSEETLIKMVRSMTLACYICDGRGVQSFEKLKVSWKAGLAREFPSDLSKAQLKWVQDKYNTLGFTQCAMSLMTNARLTVQMEALRLLHTLLIGGNADVQNAIASILASDQRLSEAWFGSIEAVLVRCGETLKAQAARLEKAKDTPDDDLDDGDDLDEFDEEDDELEARTTRFNDSHNPFVFASEMISMLQLMCEGHNTSNQVMMHEQPMNANSVDVLSECVNLIGLMQIFLAESATSGKMQLPQLTMKICGLLTEACLGPCYPTQNMLALNSPLISLSNRMLSTIVIEETDSPRVIQTKANILSALLQVLCSLLEGSTNESISNRIKDVLDFSAVESQLIVLMSRMKIDMSIASEAVNPGFTPDEAFASGEVEEAAVSVASFSSNPENMSMECIDLNSGLPDIEEEPHGGVNHFSFRKRGTPGKQGNGTGMSAFELDAADDDSSAPAEARHEEAAQEAVRSALLEMLFFIRKLNHKTMGSNTDLLHQGTEKEISKSVTDRMDAFMESSTASIELLWNGNIEKVFFPLTPMCRELDKNAKWKQELIGHLQSVPSECRSNPLQKAISLMHLMDVAAADLTAIGYLNQNFQWFKFIVDRQQIAWRLSFFVSALILTIMTLSIRESVEAWQSSPGWSYWACLALCYFQLALTLLIAVSFASYDATRSRTITDPKFGSRVMESIAKSFNGIACMRSNRVVDGALGTRTLQKQQMSSSFGAFVRSESSRKHGSSFTNQFNKILSKINPPPKDDDHMDIHALMYNAAVIVLDVACFWRTWYILALLVSAILGLSMSPFYTTFFLTVFFVEFSAGKTIVRALGEAGMPLLKTSLMGVVVIIVFSVASFVFFREADVEGLQCETMYQCVATHLITGMYGDFSVLFYGGDIHQIVPLGIDDDAGKQMQVFFVLGFFIIWGFVLSNIFTGQVVDAFASIRAEEANVQHDNATHCLVCSLERFEFDKNPKTSFDHHTACEHNPLAYVYYLHYLRTTETTEFKGYDTAVNDILLRQSLVERSSWLPISRSITLENLEAAGTKSLQEASEKQTDLLEYLKSMVQRMDARITGIENQMQQSSQ